MGARLMPLNNRALFHRKGLIGPDISFLPSWDLVVHIIESLIEVGDIADKSSQSLSNGTDGTRWHSFCGIRSWLREAV